MAGSRGAERILNDDKNQFEKEQSDLIKFILNERYFKPWSLHQKNPEGYFDREHSLWSEAKLELYLTSTCNQKCEYCYLQQFPKLYPKEVNKKETIMRNLVIILNWLIENDYYLPELEFFTGEIWHLDWGLEVFEETYKALQRGLRIDSIMIPSNCSFVLDEVQLCKLQRYIDKFQREFNVRVIFSISVDGMIIEEETRPLNNKIVKTEDYYERLFLFAQHNQYFFHPMVGAYKIDKWIENHEWWTKMCEEYDMEVEQAVMMLEVRNDNWSDEDIQHYCNFLKHLVMHKLKLCKNDIGLFSQKLLSFYGEGGGYLPYSPSPADTFAGCTVASSLTIRVGDLAICPCHRTAYNQFLYGYFIEEQGKIVDIVGNNPQMAIRILMANNNLCSFKCDTCLYNIYCMKGCFGSQFENVGDPFMPIEGICKLYQTKWKFLVNLYNDLGVLDYLRNNTKTGNEAWERVQQFLNFCQEVLNNE